MNKCQQCQKEISEKNYWMFINEENNQSNFYCGINCLKQNQQLTEIAKWQKIKKGLELTIIILTIIALINSALTLKKIIRKKFNINHD